MAILYFMRHGFTEANRDEIIAGIFEAHLLPEGMEQARQAGSFLRDKGIKKAFCSPLLRTQETWKALQLKNIPVEFEQRLMEIHCGVYEGLPFSELPAEFQFGNLWRHPELCPPQGESARQVRARLRAFIEDKLNGTDETILVVGHGGSGTALLLELMPTIDLVKNPVSKRGMLMNGEIARLEGGRFEKVFASELKSQ
jgi:broad specificity phosphatase PhoE